MLNKENFWGVLFIQLIIHTKKNVLVTKQFLVVIRVLSEPIMPLSVVSSSGPSPCQAHFMSIHFYSNIIDQDLELTLN